MIEIPKMQPLKKAFFTIFITTLLISSIWISPETRKYCCAKIYKTFPSPDQRFQVLVYSLPTPIPILPGSSSDLPGFIRLQTRAGAVLQEKDIEMVQLINQVDWNQNHVEIKLIADWELPEP